MILLLKPFIFENFLLGANDLSDDSVDGDSYSVIKYTLMEQTLEISRFVFFFFQLSNMDGRWRKPPTDENSLYGTDFENPADPVSGFGNIFRTALAPSGALSFFYNPIVVAALVFFVVLTA